VQKEHGAQMQSRYDVPGKKGGAGGHGGSGLGTSAAVKTLQSDPGFGTDLVRGTDLLVLPSSDAISIDSVLLEMLTTSMFPKSSKKTSVKISRGLK
jgi:hypothetical protein